MAGQEFADVPVQVLVLQKDDTESRKAELKFQRSLQAFGRIHPDLIEARAVVKKSLLEKERRQYEVQVFIKLPKEQFDFDEEGWSIEEVFEKIGEKIKRLMTKPRDRASHRRHPSRMEMESSRFAEYSIKGASGQDPHRSRIHPLRPSKVTHIIAIAAKTSLRATSTTM